MSSIKDEPTEGETFLDPSPSVNEPINQSTVKCEWSLKESCACADGQCEDCQTTEKENEKDNILKMPLAAALPRNSPVNDETEFHPSIWEDCEAAEDTDNASEAENEDVRPVFGQVDDNLADGTVIEKVNTEEIKEEITDHVEKEIANDNAEVQVDASQVAVHVNSVPPLFASRGSTRSRERFTVNVPAAEVKSESEEEGTLSSQLPIISPPEQHQSSPEEIKEEITDNIEEGNANEEAEMQVEASQMAAHVGSVSPAISSHGSTQPTNVSTVEEVIVKSESEEETTLSSQLPVNCQANPSEESNGQSTVRGEKGNVSKEVEIKEEAEEDEEGPIIEEVNPPDEMKEEITDNVEEGNACEETKMQVEASQMVNQVDVHVGGFSVATGNESQVFEPVDETREEEGPVIEEVNPEDDSPLSPWVGNTSQEAEMGEERASQMTAHVGSVSPVVFRRSTRVGKSAVNYALLPEAEEDDPNTGTSDSEEGDSDESETEIELEMETDEPMETEESSSIAVGISERHPRITAFPCRFCEKGFASRRNARGHENRLHRQIERSRPYVCSLPDCGKAFLRKSALDRHSLIHSGLRPFTCATCGETFNQKCNLKSHKMTHTEERPYTCKVCKKGFKSKRALVQHNLLHSGLKPFTCADCGDSFMAKATLERHRQGKIPCTNRFRPSASRPFSCTVEGCGRAFKEKSNLKIHIRAHSGAKAFNCTVCGGAFTSKAYLKKHRRKFHGI